MKIKKTENLHKHIKGSYKDYDPEVHKNAIYFAEDKKKIIVDGIEYGLDLESDEIDLISNIEHKDNKLTITFSNGKTKELELEDHKSYWKEVELDFPWGDLPKPDLSNKGAVIFKTIPTDYVEVDTTFGQEAHIYYDGKKEELGENRTAKMKFSEIKEHTILGIPISGESPFSANLLGSNDKFKKIISIPSKDGVVIGCSTVRSDREVILEFKGNPVIIEKRAFMIGSGFKKLNLPNSVKIIKDSALGGCGFTGYIVIPENVEYIDSGAFSELHSLDEIYVCKNTKLHEKWNSNTPAKVITYAKGETPWLE